jgi:hypothetical protein
MNKDGEPTATYYEHAWDGKQYICLGEDCPLCEIGDQPKLTAIFDATRPDD